MNTTTVIHRAGSKAGLGELGTFHPLTSPLLDYRIWNQPEKVKIFSLLDVSNCFHQFFFKLLKAYFLTIFKIWSYSLEIFCEVACKVSYFIGKK